MPREFEIFSKPSTPTVAVKRGFSWPGFFFTWIWAFVKRLWLQGGLILGCSLVATMLTLTVLGSERVLFWTFCLIVGLVVGVNGNAWRTQRLEREGYNFLGV